MMTRPARLPLLGLIPVLLGGTIATAAAQPKPAVINPAPIELADEPFRLESVGLSMRLPVGATAEATRIGEKMTAQILPADRTWLVNIQTPQTSNPQATIKEAADQTVALIQGAFGIVDPRQTKVLETEAKILQRIENLQLPGGPAERIYVSVPAKDGRIVKGYTIFKPSARQFVVFELITAESEYARARAAYETTVATATFEDPTSLAAERGQAVKAGAALLARLTREDYEAFLDGQERWVRIAKPAPTGNPLDAEEIGYRGVTFWKGKRGEVNPDRPMIRWTRLEQQEGYLCRIRARIRQGGDFLDSEGFYFMTPDRQEETWTLSMWVRDMTTGKVRGWWREVGVREGEEISVSVEENSKPARVIQPLWQSEGYLCQVESFLLPQLLVRAGIETDFGFYTYRSDSGTVAFRRDTLERDTSVAGTTAWVITTVFREDMPRQFARYTEAGGLIRTERDDQVVTPIELKQLLDLWSKKGLPVGETQPRRRR